MTTQSPEAPLRPRHRDPGRSMAARFREALLVVSLVAGFLISSRIYPTAMVGVVLASLAFTFHLGRVACDDLE